MKQTALSKAIDLMRRPQALLILTYSPDAVSGRAFFIVPCGGRVSDETAQKLLERNDVQPADSGLLPGHPQSWRLGDWRKRLKKVS